VSEARINAITAESKARLGAINAVKDLKLKLHKRGVRSQRVESRQDA
jgi:hypothetical protein